MMMYSRFSLQRLLLLSIFFCVSAAISPHVLRGGPLIRRLYDPDIATGNVTKGFKTFYYKQTLDHFSFSPGRSSTFRQLYMINSKHWGGPQANAPIFASLGAESPLGDNAPAPDFVMDIAPRFKALLVYMEHRYYGKSMPFGSAKIALKKGRNIKYLTSAQALEDYAKILLDVKQQYKCKHCPVIVFGGSYGGELASWFRLKYPHIAIGALASSAPILYYEDITSTNAYFSIVAKGFKENSETCHQTIRDSWAAIDKVASQPNGLSVLSQKFKTCKPLKDSSELKDSLQSAYVMAAQYNGPPNYPVTKVCRSIDGQPPGTDILSRIFAGLVAQNLVFGAANTSCYVNQDEGFDPTDVAWSWQACSEMVMPITGTENNTMFQQSAYNPADDNEECKKTYKITPDYRWVTTHYGGRDIKMILGKFGSNIIFSNGLRDPYSAGGVLEDISETIVALYTKEGSHCSDLTAANRTTDPSWLVKLRKDEVEIMEKWIAKYNADLKEFKNKS